MKLLALDTSTKMGSIALVEDEQLMAEYHIRFRVNYSDTLLTLIDHLLHTLQLTIHQIDGFAIALGPGSFTALRIGVSIIKGLAFSATKPVVGIPTLEGLAYNVGMNKNVLLCPIVDARKHEVYTALFKSEDGTTLKKLIPERVVTPHTLVDEIEEEVLFVGDGIDLYGEMIRMRLGEKAMFAPPHLRYPKASVLAQLALPKFLNREALSCDALTPIYVRPTEAEIKWKEKKIEY